MPSFDVVSQLDLQEVDNALNQARKEIGQRYDFKGSHTTMERDDAGIHVVSDNEPKLTAAVDVLQTKLVKRGVSLLSLDAGRIEPGAGGKTKQLIKLKQGIDEEKAKKISKLVRDAKLKVQCQIQGDQLRVSGKQRDDLQSAIQFLKQQELGLPLQFINFRD